MSLNLRRASVTLPGGVTYDKVAVVLSAGVARIWDNSGNLLAEAPASGATKDATGLRYTVTLEDGTVWTAERRSGCGCGR